MRRLSFVWGILALTAFLRIGALALLDGPDLVAASESGIIAANWVSGQGYTFDFYGYRSAMPLRSFMPPLFTGIVALCLVTPWPAAAFGAVQVALATLTVLLLYLVGARLAGPAVGAVAALLCAVYPPFLILVDQATVPVLNTFLLALWLWTTVELARTGKYRWAIASGVSLGLNTLSRPSILGLLGVTALAVKIGWDGRRRHWWVPVAVVAVAAALIAAPWLARNFWVHGRFVGISTNGGFVFWTGNNPFSTGSAFDVVANELEAYSGERVAPPNGPSIVWVRPYPLPLELRASVATLDEVALERALYRAGFDFVRTHPARWAGLVARRFISLWWFRPNVGLSGGFYQAVWIQPYRILYAGVLIVAGAGLALSRRNWRRYAPIYGMFFYLTAVYMAYNVITRYRWEMEPALLVLAALALVAASRAVMGRFRAGRPLQGVMARE